MPEFAEEFRGWADYAWRASPAPFLAEEETWAGSGFTRRNEESST